MKKELAFLFFCFLLKANGFTQCWQNVTVGHSHSLAIKTNGTLCSWGDNFVGQLGDDTYIDKNSPVQIGANNNWQNLTAGSFHSLAIKTDGTLWAWGENSEGQVGDNTNVNKKSPVQIGIDNNWQNLAAGRSHSLAIKANGTLWAWGENSGGQVGDSTNVNKKSPVQIGIDNNWQILAAGIKHSLAIKSDGTLWSWGDNQSGQLGDGTVGLNNGKTSPIQIGIDNNWQDVAAGDIHSLALKTDGTLWSWGGNYSGQLGDGTNVRRTSPIEILCLMTSVTKSELQQAIWNLYPNPAMSFINIELSEADKVGLGFEISNIFGQVIIHQQILPGSHQINIQMLSPGSYFLTIRKGNEQLAKTFVKN
jgi:alpha-tubulin suppressor-like RCC1 family protein